MPAPQLAVGLIVSLDTSRLRASTMTARDVIGLALGEDAGPVRVRSLDRVLVSFEGLRTAEQAQEMARRLTARPEVAWAEPDLLLQRNADPALPNDRYFSDQWALWDPPGDSDYGLQAPLGWTATRGSADTVVAVLDTGFTDHPDLAGQVINGYDFISEPLIANDGDGRDRDAHDPGDWVTEDEARGTYEGCGASRSSWHGTHVTGTVVAKQGNRVGVSGVAPGARVLAVRVLGKCGGSTSDIVDGIVWAAGGRVSGVPVNRNPADVISMSLGGTSPCRGGIREAISFARSKGTVVVVAAGNEGKPISTSVPANCPGVIPVVAISRKGMRPEWSNYGTRSMPGVIAAPGVDIVSTYNSGSRRPSSPSYESASGTSMAAPHVAGAVALLMSSGYSAAEVPDALSTLVRTFPRQGSYGACSRVECGAGLLNLSSLGGPPEPPPGPDPTQPPGIVGPATVSYDPKGAVATATVRWQYDAPEGEPAAQEFRYRVRIAGTSWTAWKTTRTKTLTVENVPRGDLSLVEIAAVNSLGTGPVLQVTLYPS